MRVAPQRVLELLGDGLHEMAMPELGIGTGRTGYTFAPLVRRYVGLDYSARMLEEVRRVIKPDGASSSPRTRWARSCSRITCRICSFMLTFHR